MALVGLTLGVGNLGISTLNAMGKNTHSKTTQAHQKHRGMMTIAFAFPTVATPLASTIVPGWALPVNTPKITRFDPL
jgi:hypothetical protein